MIRKLLIANRGEIAVRVARTAREMGIQTVAVFSEADDRAFHRLQTDFAASLGAGPPAETYLSVERVLAAARSSGADAIHPGYGFLSENAAFARAVREAGLTWIGPDPESIEAMGGKLEARRLVGKAGVPVVPGSSAVTSGEADSSAGLSSEALAKEEASAKAEADSSAIALARAESSAIALAAAEAERIGYPVLVKASAGGGGKAMARVDSRESLPAALAQARRLAAGAFGDETVYLEKLLEGPRHVEFQVFGDRSGNVVHLFERECSVQRRHQKILEETPSPALDPELRAAMGRAAVEAARAVRYVGAGTVEFLLDAGRRFYFLEMNTRLQVEHPITEETLGVDLVRAQIEVAAGEDLPPAWRAGSLSPRGHAIELRLYAEDPEEFLPRSGRLAAYEEPRGPGIRVDSGVAAGSEVGLDFDPLLAKLVVSAADRRCAIERARRAVSEWVVLGVETNLPLLSAVLDSEEFVSGRYDTGLVGRLPSRLGAAVPDSAWIAAALAFQRTDLASASSAVDSTSAGSLSSEALAKEGDPWADPAGWRPFS